MSRLLLSSSTISTVAISASRVHAGVTCSGKVRWTAAKSRQPRLWFSRFQLTRPASESSQGTIFMDAIDRHDPISVLQEHVDQSLACSHVAEPPIHLFEIRNRTGRCRCSDVCGTGPAEKVGGVHSCVHIS